MAKAAEKRRDASVSAKDVGLGPKGDLWRIIGIWIEAEHTVPECGEGLKGRGSDLLESKVNALAARDTKEPISTLPLITTAYD